MTTSPNIPASIDDVTAEWLSEALGKSVDTVRSEQIGVGVGVSSAVYRVHLTGTDVPDTVVVKLPALAEEAVFTATMLRMYIREVKFFDEMAADCPIHVPQGLFGAVDEETSRFIIVMEDMGDMRAIDQIEGMAIADAERAIDELAAWHAAYWGKSEALVESGAVVPLSDPVYPAVLPIVWAEGWEKLSNEIELSEAILSVGPAWPDKMPTILQELCTGPTTAAHGDFRADNIMFADDGSLVLLDFQLTGHATGAYDVAYFVTQSLTSEDASAHEKRLFQRWIDALIANGVPEADTADLWTQYRRAAYFCLVYPIVASRGMDLSDPRQMALIGVMNERFGRAVTELNLAEFAQ